MNGGTVMLTLTFAVACLAHSNPVNLYSRAADPGSFAKPDLDLRVSGSDGKKKLQRFSCFLLNRVSFIREYNFKILILLYFYLAWTMVII